MTKRESEKHLRNNDWSEFERNQKLILFFLILKMGDIFSLSEEALKEASPKTVSRGVAGLEESDLKVR